MKKGQEPAFPSKYHYMDDIGIMQAKYTNGMSTRLYIATNILSGMLSNSSANTLYSDLLVYYPMAKIALKYADAILGMEEK